MPGNIPRKTGSLHEEEEVIYIHSSQDRLIEMSHTPSHAV